jgi:hypothetical protein
MKLLTLFLLLLVGCSAHRTRVDCEGHVTPINAPAPALSSPKPPSTAPASGARP